MSKVALIRCESYDNDTVKTAVQRGIDLLGGAAAFVKNGEKILLKPNWIMAVPPERCATTNPSVFKAVCEIFQAAGAILSYGDSPGSGTTEEAALEAAEVTGFLDVASKLNIPLADFLHGRDIKTTGGFESREFYIANGALDCDGIISLPKLKTHGFLKMTGAIKNQLGTIPGKRKGAYHAQIHKPADFARMLIDLNAFLHPRLYIMDGIVAMEGNGPMNGDPKKMNLLLLSADPVALDATVCRLVDVKPEYSYTVTLGMQAKQGTYLARQIELVGDPLESFITPDFKVNRDPISNIRIGQGVFSFQDDSTMPKPYIVEEKCVRCGVCVDMCPIEPKVVDWHDGDVSHAPTYDYSRCIRCFCCQEVCPNGAIFIKEPTAPKPE